MLSLSKGELDLLVIVTLLKILLLPSYRSTDFEVHRNWLAITHSLPLREWYFEHTSEWTLDYPPFFAYFSWILALPSYLLPTTWGETLLRISKAPVETWFVTAYMRLSVLITEGVLCRALLRLASRSSEPQTARIIALAVSFHPGFLILDHMHFQYNAFLFGVMVWSLIGAREKRPLLCAGAFAALLNFKHIYVYLAPAWFIYLLRAYCWPPSIGLNLLNIRFDALARTGLVTVAVFTTSLAPFLLSGQGEQLLSRLFPFTRGLMHAYWAPNAWAGVALLDRVLLQISKRLRLGFAVSAAGIDSTSRGLVGDTHFAVLPEISPRVCFLITAVTQLLQLIPLWRRPDYRNFLKAITACGFSSFMFGWHVHEKAVMLILVPLSLLAAEDWNLYQAFIVASVPGIVGLFPLLFKAAETPVKLGYSSIWALVVFTAVRKHVIRPEPSVASYVVDGLQRIYLYSVASLLVSTSILLPIFALCGRISHTFEFLPLMATSVWCSLGLWLAWGRLVFSLFWDDRPEPEVRVKVD